jgi:hypothetical protein
VVLALAGCRCSASAPSTAVSTNFYSELIKPRASSTRPRLRNRPVAHLRNSYTSSFDRWTEQAKCHCFEVLSDCREVKLIASVRKSSQAQAFEAVIEVREAHLNLLSVRYTALALIGSRISGRTMGLFTNASLGGPLSEQNRTTFAHTEFFAF